MAIFGERMLRKLVMLLVAVEAARAEPVASPKNSRIALRYSTARVLIVGGVLEAGSDATIKELRGIQKRFPKLENADQVGGAWMNVVPRNSLAGGSRNR